MKLAIRSVTVMAVCTLMSSQGCGDSGNGGVNEPPVPTPSSIVIAPASLGLMIAETGQLSAAVFDSTGAELSVQVTWASMAPSVFSVSASGLVAGLAAGTGSARASAGQVNADATITVSGSSTGPPSSISIVPASLDLLVGESGQLSATVYDSSGAELAVQVDWEALHPTVASVAASGMVTGLAAGSATVRAATSGVSADADVTVSSPVLGEYGRCPVLFVHGSGLSSQSFGGMIEFLEQGGYPPQYLSAVDLIPNDGANAVAASQTIAPAVEDLLVAARAAAVQAGYGTAHLETVCIVSHSMGAASSRWYVAKIRPDRVVVWVSIAGANHGTDALAGLPGEGNAEMVPAFAETMEDSPFQVTLNGTSLAPEDESPFGVGADPGGTPSVPPDDERRVAYFTVRIDPDEWIKPEDSALLAGAGGVPVDLPPGLPGTETTPGNYLLDVPSSHDGLPFDPWVKSLVAALLHVADE